MYSRLQYIRGDCNNLEVISAEEKAPYQYDQEQLHQKVETFHWLSHLV